MKLSDQSIRALVNVITGDKTAKGEPIAPYQSGPDLIAFFHRFGFNDRYENFGTRWRYVDEKLRSLNGSERVRGVIEAALDPRRYVDSRFAPEMAAEYLNTFLAYDDLSAVKRGRRYTVHDLRGNTVAMERTFSNPATVSHEFINDQIEKCDRKIAEADYWGAMTNARSLLEAVLINIESALDPSPVAYDGELQKLLKRLQKLLNLEPTRPDIRDSLRQVLSGLTTVVHGIAPMRNKMSDSHATNYKPHRHHAKLAVNACKTVADFLFDTFEYQRSKGLLAALATTSTDSHKVAQ